MFPNQSEQANATVIANNNYFPGRNGLLPRYVILHGTAGMTSSQALGNYFMETQSSGNPVSSHYGIGTGGNIVQYVSERDGAWANGAFSAGHDTFWNESINPNNITISIEHCKPSADNHDILTPAQQEASFTLINDICDRWHIPKRAADATGGITGHFSIDPVNRQNCPGVYPWNDLWTFLKGENPVLDLTDPVVAKYFKDGGNGTWKCSNGVTLLGANLTFYRTYGGPAVFGLPLSNELHTTQYPNTAIVPCERALIVYDPARTIDNPPIAGPCYLLHINQGIGQQMIARTLTDPLNAKIAQLQAQTAQSANVTDLKNRLVQINTLSKV